MLPLGNYALLGQRATVESLRVLLVLLNFLRFVKIFLQYQTNFMYFTGCPYKKFIYCIKIVFSYFNAISTATLLVRQHFLRLDYYKTS